MIANARIWLTITAVALCAARADAQLVWEQTEIELRPALGDETAVGHFKYQNKGDKPVAITNIATSCGCTAASTKKDAIAPGEKGEVTATFTIGNRVGTQQKTITVSTDDPSQPSTALHLKVEIPQILDVQPAFVFWQTGEPPKPKIITAKPGSGVSITKLQVTSSSPDFSTAVESVNEVFQIRVTPRQTKEPVYATLTIKPDSPKAPNKTFPVIARVLPPVPARGAETHESQNQLDACALLTSDEIKAVQGEPVKESKGARNTTPDTISTCYFLLPTASNSISLTVVQKGEGSAARDPKEFWQQIFHGEKRKEKEEEGEEDEKSAEPERIADLGDEAYWLGNRVGGALMVLKGNVYFKISVGGAGDQETKIRKSKELAQKILPRL